MNSWPEVAISECAEIVSGATPSTAVPEFWDGEIRWATPKDLSDLQGSYLTETARTISSAGLQSCAATVLPTNSVLFSSRAPIGLVAVNTVPMATNQGFKSFVPRPGKLDPKFLFHWLRFHRSKLESMGNGATFKELSKAAVERISIALPPLAEQRRIAAILDKADGLRVNSDIVLDGLDRVEAALFRDSFGDAVRNERGWVVKKVCQFVRQFQGGKNVNPAEDDAARSARYRILKVSAVTGSEFLPTETKPLPDEYIPPDDYVVRPGDLLFSRANTKELVGATALVFQTPPNLILPDKIWRFVWSETSAPNPIFVWFLFRAPEVRALLSKLATGSSGSMKNISQEKVLSIPLIFPPHRQQDEFANKVLKARAVRASLFSYEKRLTGLFCSLQHRAFRGEL